MKCAQWHDKGLLQRPFTFFHCMFTIVFYACSLAVLKENISAGPCCVFFFFFFKLAFEMLDNSELQ